MKEYYKTITISTIMEGETETYIKIRCEECNKLLFKYTGGKGNFQTKCNRCKSLNTISFN